jgi:hypothetical protein
MALNLFHFLWAKNERNKTEAPNPKEKECYLAYFVINFVTHKIHSLGDVYLEHSIPIRIRLQLP